MVEIAILLAMGALLAAALYMPHLCALFSSTCAAHAYAYGQQYAELFHLSLMALGLG